MCVVQWTLSQLLSYGVRPWLLFLIIASVAAYLLRAPGVFLGHLIVGGAVVILDVRWIQSETNEPGWDGLPDQDFVFIIGVVARILLVNITLLPISLVALRLRKRRGARKT